MKSTRKAYGEFLCEIGEKDENIVVLDADLAKATCTESFQKTFPQRHFDMGIAEQDLVGTASGFALMNKKVFASSFAMFLAGRAYEQIRNTAAYSFADVNLVATHSGLAVGEDGPTHQCLEDIALMNVIPHMTVLCPSDEYSTKAILKECYEKKGPKYIRLGRNEVESIYSEKEQFEIGKSKQLGEGKDGCIFAIGNTVPIALQAQKELKEKGIFVIVADMYSIKPIDKQAILKLAQTTETLVSIEDHSVIGGLGSIISNVLCEENPKKLIKIGVNDKFGKSGDWKAVYDKYGLTKENIIKQFTK